MTTKTCISIVILALFAGCSNSSKNAYISVPYRDENWGVSQKNNRFENSEAILKAKNFDFLYSILIAQNNELILEKYFNGASDSVAFDIKSVTKSFTSGLIGIALHQKIIDGLDSKLKDLLPEYFKNQQHVDKAEITLRQLLTMQGGYSYHSTRDIFETDDWINNILNYKLEFALGEKFCYAACESHLLSAIIAEKSGLKTEDFAKKYLFDPLKINIGNWVSDPNGINNGNAGLYMTSRDLLSYGQLYLNHGRYNGKQVIPSDWIANSIINSNNGLPRCEESNDIPFSGYGYHWWLDSLDNQKAIIASGYGGNFIFILPDLNMTIVTNANTNIGWQNNADNVNKIINLLTDLIEEIKTAHNN